MPKKVPSTWRDRLATHLPLAGLLCLISVIVCITPGKLRHAPAQYHAKGRLSAVLEDIFVANNAVHVKRKVATDDASLFLRTYHLRTQQRVDCESHVGLDYGDTAGSNTTRIGRREHASAREVLRGNSGEDFFGWGFARVGNHYPIVFGTAIRRHDALYRTYPRSLVHLHLPNARGQRLSALPPAACSIGSIQPIGFFSGLHLLNSSYRSAQRGIGAIGGGLRRFSHLNELTPVNQANHCVDNSSCDADTNDPPFATSDVLLKVCGRIFLFVVGIASAGISWFVMISRRLQWGLNIRIGLFTIGYISAIFCVWHALEFFVTS